MIAPSLLEAAARHLGRGLRPVARLEGGEEAMVFRLESDAGPLVLHVSPPWRSRAELEWAHAVSALARASVSQAASPLTGSGGTILEWEGRWAAVSPFVEGEMLDREDAGLRLGAVELLADIHNALAGATLGPRPPSGPGHPSAPPGAAELEDAELDRWWREHTGGLLQGVVHGDYYRRNLLCRAGRIVAVIDWTDALIQPLALELAGATFEFCRDDDHVLDYDRARAFVAAYCRRGGPVPARELGMIVPLARWWVRRDAQAALAAGPSVDDYARNQVRAFHALRDVRLEGE